MKTFLTGNQSTLLALTSPFRADLFKIDLTVSPAGFGSMRGAVLYATNGQQDVAYGGQTYYSKVWGAWERGTISSAADFSLESKAMGLTLVADSTVMAPSPNSDVTLMSIVQAGLFDGANVDVWSVWMSPAWGQVVVAMKAFSGAIASCQQAGRSKIEFEVRDWNYLLNLKVPMRTIQAGCFHTLFNHGCALSASAWALSNTAGIGTTQTVIVPGTAWPSSGWPNGQAPNASQAFVNGRILWSTGKNAGLPGHVIAENDSTGALTLWTEALFPISLGDAFYAYPGCDKSLTTCTQKFANAKNFSGFPFVPPPEQSI